MPIQIGLKGRAETVVTTQNTAAAIGSGLVPVFATPMMIALMESASVTALSGQLEEGNGTVGTALTITHDAATPIGMRVWAEAEVTAVDGKAIGFTVRCYDEAGQIGGGTHQRFVITTDRFLAKAQQRKNRQ
ncbi:MAG: thioesterase family protein [Oscillospiraceae bacterium]